MHIPILTLSVASLLLTQVLGSCSINECFQALNDAPSQIVTSDCASFFGGLKVSSTATVVRTVDVTDTDTFTVANTETAIVVLTDVALRKWEDRRRARNILLRRTSPGSTVKTTAVLPQTPEYASPCLSLNAYSSACSCLGITSVTPTAAETGTDQKSSVVAKVTTTIIMHTHAVVSNSTTLFRNSTAAIFANSTAVSENAAGSRRTSLSSSVVNLNASSSRVSAKVSSEVTSSRSTGIQAQDSFGDTRSPSHIESSGGQVDSSSSASVRGSANTFNATKASLPPNGTVPYPNATDIQTLEKSLDSWYFGIEANSARFQNAPAPGPAANATKVVNNTTAAPRLNSAHASNAPYVNVTTSSWLIRSTAAAPFRNATLAALLNETTAAPFMNTTSLPALDMTRARLANTTARMFANSTSVRFSNASTPAPTATATTTLDQTCGETTTPFLLLVQQPDGLLDGWHLRLSGDAILFTASADSASRFSVESSGHLCVVGHAGESGNAAIAIAETGDGPTGSAIYFVDGARLERYLGARGYGALACAVSDDSLGCQAGRDLAHWVACGLGLDISSDGAPSVVVDAWNCTSIGLSAVLA